MVAMNNIRNQLINRKPHPSSAPTTQWPTGNGPTGDVTEPHPQPRSRTLPYPQLPTTMFLNKSQPPQGTQQETTLTD